MTYSFTEKKRIRNNFGTRESILKEPDLLSIQINSFNAFIQKGATEKENIKLGIGNYMWGDFNLKESVGSLAARTGESEELILKKFTNLSLRQFNKNSTEQWQCHPSLGLYKTLKKDAYKND